MNTTFNWLGKMAAAAGLLSITLFASGSALAATYNIILKTTGGVVQTCASGGFSFNKSVAGSFPTTSPSVVLSGSAQTPCFGVDALKTLSPGSLNVTVANVTLNGEDQGPNVVSINGALTSGNGSNNYTINFSSNKTFTINQNTGQNPVVGTGVYHIYNASSTVPEPETLLLALMGLGALAVSRRKWRRS